MAAASQSTSFAEALRKINADIAEAQTTPDADMQFLAHMQAMVIARFRQGATGTPGATGRAGMQPPGAVGGTAPGGPGGPMPPMGGAGPMGGPPGPGGPPMGMPGGGMGGPNPMPNSLPNGPSPAGVTPMPQTPSPDELRRLMQSLQGA